MGHDSCLVQKILCSFHMTFAFVSHWSELSHVSLYSGWLSVRVKSRSSVIMDMEENGYWRIANILGQCGRTSSH